MGSLWKVWTWEWHPEVYEESFDLNCCTRPVIREVSGAQLFPSFIISNIIELRTFIKEGLPVLLRVCKVSRWLIRHLVLCYDYSENIASPHVIFIIENSSHFQVSSIGFFSSWKWRKSQASQLNLQVRAHGCNVQILSSDNLHCFNASADAGFQQPNWIGEDHKRNWESISLIVNLAVLLVGHLLIDMYPLVSWCNLP